MRRPERSYRGAMSDSNDGTSIDPTETPSGDRGDDAARGEGRDDEATAMPEELRDLRPASPPDGQAPLP